MRTDIKIDFVATPFAGHLFPPLQLAKYAKSNGFDNLRLISCPRMRAPVEHEGIEFLPLLAEWESEVLDIVLGTQNVYSSFKKVFEVVNRTLDLQKHLKDELRDYWQKDRPDLVVVDYISPFSGVVAEELGIPWWTFAICPTDIEAKRGTPGHLGGWEQPTTPFGKCRDTLGRLFIRVFKNICFFLFRKKIQALGFKSVYREDGSERMYSSDVILGNGIPEFQFENDWPKAMHWIGACTESPVFDHPAPTYEPGKKHIFVSCGTQIPWAKERAEKVFREVARMLPEYIFHFTLGSIDIKEPRIENNLHFYGYIPYTSESFQNYDVVVNHGGVGVLYAAMMAGVPQLIWSQDHDQPDNAARVNFHGLGLRTRGKPQDIVAKIKKLLGNDSYRKKAEEYRQIANRYHPGKSFVELVQKKFAQ